jgi:hypothetical protein
MHKFMEFVGYALALIGLATVVKHLAHHNQEGCMLCGLSDKVKEKKSQMTQKTGEQEERRTGSRYGSNPINY